MCYKTHFRSSKNTYEKQKILYEKCQNRYENDFLAFLRFFHLWQVGIFILASSLIELKGETRKT
jgi:hypothetical protein